METLKRSKCPECGSMIVPWGVFPKHLTATVSCTKGAIQWVETSEIVKEVCPYGCMMVFIGPSDFVEESIQAHYEATHQFDSADDSLPWERYEDDLLPSEEPGDGDHSGEE